MAGATALEYGRTAELLDKIWPEVVAIAYDEILKDSHLHPEGKLSKPYERVMRLKTEQRAALTMWEVLLRRFPTKLSGYVPKEN